MAGSSKQGAARPSREQISKLVLSLAKRPTALPAGGCSRGAATTGVTSGFMARWVKHHKLCVERRAGLSRKQNLHTVPDSLQKIGRRLRPPESRGLPGPSLHAVHIALLLAR